MGRFAAFCLALLSLWPCDADAVASGNAMLEYAIKATFLYKFAPFVEWPPAAFESATSPMVICIFGADQVSREADRLAVGQRAGMRPIAIRHLEAVTPESGCHILYIAETSDRLVAGALGAVGGAPVLTVTDMARTGRDAGMISFVIQDNRVRFDIDVAAVQGSGLTISSRLLSLARTVRRAP
jgi:hypothetical protein